MVRNDPLARGSIWKIFCTFESFLKQSSPKSAPKYVQRSEERGKNSKCDFISPFCEVHSTFLSFLNFHASDPYLDFLIKLICKRIRRMQAQRIELVAGKFLDRKYQSSKKFHNTADQNQK